MSAHDVFVSYAHQDKVVADAACALLERGGVRCWIAPRDVRPGHNYAESIMDAIESARGMLFVFSDHANKSPHVEREIERAVSNGLCIVPLRIEDVVPRRSFEYYISSSHWLDALTPPLEQHLDRLTDAVRRLLATSCGSTRSAPAVTAPVEPATLSPPVEILPVGARVPGDWTRDAFREAVTDPGDRAFLDRIFHQLDSQTRVLGNHAPLYFGKRPRGGVFFYPFRLRHPPFQLGINGTGQLAIKGNWRTFPQVAGHAGFAELAALLGQHQDGPTKGVPVAGLDWDRVWEVAERTARIINA